MKTLEEILEDLKQLEQTVNSSDGNFSEQQLEEIANKLESSFGLAQAELQKIEEQAQILSTQTDQDEE
jgi:ElaB/YqjD/DUF883 family membrane-anchored ribosome-binding protein